MNRQNIRLSAFAEAASVLEAMAQKHREMAEAEKGKSGRDRKMYLYALGEANAAAAKKIRMME